MKKKYIIIGASAAGVSCANRLRQLDLESEIMCITHETETSYNKCLLADYMTGTKSINQLYTLTREQAEQKNITILFGKKVIGIEPDAKNITLDDGTSIGMIHSYLA